MITSAETAETSATKNADNPEVGSFPPAAASANETDPSSSSSSSMPNNSKSNGWIFGQTTVTVTTMTTLTMWILYGTAVVWHSLHPMASILSGRFNHPLTPFIDENAIDVNMFRGSTFGSARRTTMTSAVNHGRINNNRGSVSLCQALMETSRTGDVPYIPCFSISLPSSSSFQVAQIVPIQAPVAPRSEALVVVVHTTATTTMAIMAEFAQFLAAQSPWLAKTVFIVATTGAVPPATTNTAKTTTRTAKQTVHSFLDWYLGRTTAATTTTGDQTFWNHNLVPAELAGSMIRQLLVVDTTEDSCSRHRRRRGRNNNNNNKDTTAAEANVYVLPTGERGVMPNMDLYTVVLRALQRAFSDKDQIQVYSCPSPPQPPWRRIRNHVSKWLPASLQNWWLRLCDFVAWEVHVATTTGRASGGDDDDGDVASFSPPHATALDRGVDALTIQLGNTNNDDDLITKNVIIQIFASLELALHALSNAHERLHHNTALYTLPLSHGNGFVKHEEFLVPTLLLLIPLIVRAVQLLFLNRCQDYYHNNHPEEAPKLFIFDFAAACWVLRWMLGGTALAVYGLEAVDRYWGPNYDNEDSIVPARRSAMVLVYVMVLPGMFLGGGGGSSPLTLLLPPPPRGPYARDSLQFVACLAALYLHLPIAFGYVALAFPSACCWTMVIALLSPRTKSKLLRLVTWFLCLVTCPALLVPNIFADFTPYVKYVYLPLHISACALWLLPPVTWSP